MFIFAMILNLTGLRIHQTKMHCLRNPEVQRTVPVPSTAPGKTEEGPGPDTPHSAENLKAPQVTPQSRPSEHRRILWPADNKESEWHRFDEDVDSALEVTAKVDVDERSRSLCPDRVPGSHRFEHSWMILR